MKAPRSISRMNPRPCALALAAAAALLPASRIEAASVAVNWGGNYVYDATGNQQFSNQGTNSSTGGFSGGDPLEISPTIGDSYAGLAAVQPPVTSARFYGSLQTFTTPAPTKSLGQIVNAGSSLDRIELKASDTKENTGFLLLWKQGDFLNGLDTGNVGFDATTTVGMNVVTYATQSADSGRLVLRLSGGSYYISERTFTSTGSLSATPTMLNYFSYDPATSINPGEPVTPDANSIISGGSIANVTEVGFYFESSDSTGADAVRIDTWTVNMVAIPEPGALALAFVGLAGFAFSRRR